MTRQQVNTDDPPHWFKELQADFVGELEWIPDGVVVTEADKLMRSALGWHLIDQKDSPHPRAAPGYGRHWVRRMNRHQRRAAMKETGHTWASARALAKRHERERASEARIAAMASRMSPEEARKALAYWAARGGDLPKAQTFEFTEVNDPTNFNARA